jgi:hypothetical protein
MFTFQGSLADWKNSPKNGNQQCILPVLKGELTQKQREFLYYDMGQLQCYRNGDWKLKLPWEGFEGVPWKKGVPPHDTLLFNLKSDPGEQNNLYFDSPKKVAEMVAQMEVYRASKGEFPPSLMEGHEADKIFYNILSEKPGNDYYKAKW